MPSFAELHYDASHLTRLRSSSEGQVCHLMSQSMGATRAISKHCRVLFTGFRTYEPSCIELTESLTPQHITFVGRSASAKQACAAYSC